MFVSRSARAMLFRLVASLIIVLLAFSGTAFSYLPAYADDAESSSEPQEQAQSTGRFINILYDDSKSMDTDPESSWASAHYAIEVLSNFLGEDDVLKIYTMSGSMVTIDGSWSAADRVAAASDHFSKDYSSTVFDPAFEAYKDLKKQPATAEKWLIVLTDGDFTDVEELHWKRNGKGASWEQVAERVNGYLANWANEGIKVEYLVMSNDVQRDLVPNPVGNPNFNVNNTDDKGILKGIVQEAQTVFNMVPLNANVNEGAGKASVEIGIPSKKLIVFAQGASPEVSGLVYKPTASSNTISLDEPDDSAAVTCPDRPHEVDSSDYAVCNEEVLSRLNGTVATYDNGGEGFEAGRAEINFSGEEVAIYCVPNVAVQMTVTDSAGYTQKVVVPGQSDLSVTSGQNEVDIRLINPTTGEDLTNSEYITESKITANLTYADGESVDLTSGTVTLKGGEGILKVGAKVNGYNVVDHELSAFPSLDIEVVDCPDPISVDAMASDSPQQIVVSVTKSGEPLTTEQMERATVALSTSKARTYGFPLSLILDDKGIEYEVTANESDSTFTLTPRQYEGSAFKTVCGKTPLTFTAMFAGQPKGEITQEVNIEGPFILLRFLNWVIGHLPLIIALIALTAFLIAARKHMTAPRLPKNLKPDLYDTRDKGNNAFKVICGKRETPFFGAETQQLTLRYANGYDMGRAPRSLTLVATDKKGHMRIAEWDSLVKSARDGVAGGASKDAIKIGNRKLSEVKDGEEPMILTTGKKLSFKAYFASEDENRTIELKLKK